MDWDESVTISEEKNLKSSFVILAYSYCNVVVQEVQL